MKLLKKIDGLNQNIVIIGTTKDLSQSSDKSIKIIFKQLKTHSIPVLRDAYHITEINNAIIISASNERSLFYALFAFEDWIKNREIDNSELDIFEESHFEGRWMNPTQQGHPDEKENIEYLLRIGVNTTYLRGRYDIINGAHGNYRIDLQTLRSSVSDKLKLPIFSKYHKPDPANVKAVTNTYNLAVSHGMETVHFVDEPQTISATTDSGKAIIKSLSTDMIGYPALSSHRSKGNVALCLFHPKIESHYRELAKNLLKKFPKLGNLYVYNQDDGSDNCWPLSDPYGKNFYPEGYSKYPYAAHIQIVKILQDEGKKINPAFKVITGTWHWFWEKEATAKMISGLPKGAGLCCLNTNDDRIAVVEPMPQIHNVLKLLKKRKDLVFIADDDFNATSDDLMMAMTAGYPTMFRTYKKMNKWAKEGATEITQHHTGGPSLLMTSLNDLAWRYFSWHPLVEEKEASAKIWEILMLQLRNKKASTLFLKATRLIDKALDLDEQSPRPYNARIVHGLYTMKIPLLPENLPKLISLAKENEYYRSIKWHKTLAKEIMILEKALGLARKGEAQAPVDQQPFNLFWNGKTPSKITCRTYAMYHCNSIEIIYRMKICLMNFISAILSSDRKSLIGIIKLERDNLSKLIHVLESHKKWDAPDYNDNLIKDFKKKLAAMKG